MKNLMNYGTHELSRKELVNTQGGVLGWIFAAAVAVTVVGRAGWDFGREAYHAMK